MSGMPPDPRPRRALPPWGEAALVGMFVLLVVGGVLAWAWSASRTGPPARTPSRELAEAARPDPGYVGARACAECHPGEHAAHARSGHNRTLRPAGEIDLARLLDGKAVADPEVPGVSWRYALEGGRLTVERSGGGESGKIAIDYALGSGAHATTFVSLSEPGPSGFEALEHRLSYFAEGETLALTPGQHEFSRAGQSPYGYVLPAPQTLDCFGCHSTRTSARGGAELDVATMIPNVSCERCHGPGRAHVERARAGALPEALAMPSGTRGVAAESEVRLCGACHRLPEKLPPGSIRPDNPVLPRFPSVGLLQSRCYTQAAGALRCTTCHDPHLRVSHETTAYEATCLSCHGPAPHVPCPVSPKTGCVSCHMPKSDVGRGLSFTDHWIRIRRGEGPPP